MRIYLNEIEIKPADGISAYALRASEKPLADIIIVNGYPLTGDQTLRDGDRVVMIQRGLQPAAAELETLMMARHTPGVHEKLKRGRIGIAGLGGLGSHVASALARVGIGYLHLVDYDVVEPSNLNRQLYFIDQLGRPKVEALKATLERTNPAVRVRCTQEKVTEDTVRTLFADIDILVEAFDAAAEKSMLIRNFLNVFPEKIIIAASGVAGHEASNSIKTARISKNLILCGDGTTAAQPGCGLMAPRVGIAAHHQANAVVRVLLDEAAE